MTEHENHPSSGDTSITVENLTKIYKLYDTPQDRLKESLHPLRRKYHRDFHALKDVSFEIRKGETVGIVGRNGSGKSTLLKLITGVLTPTSGNISTKGKISALLELGAGFNPLLTGIENVYFNGTILGYTREEMDAKLDNILSFADIGDFINQPVQTYSSGMFVRLAFAVAVHVDPDILIVDEALAVGDALIQKKCMDKMHDFQNEGKTILLVSHSLESIKNFADRGIVFNNGQVHFDGPSEKAVTEYMRILFPAHQEAPPSVTNKSSDNKAAPEPSLESPDLEIVPSGENLDQTFGAGGANIEKIQLFNNGNASVIHGGEDVKFRIRYRWEPAFVLKLIQEHGLSSNLLFGMSFEHVNGTTVSAFSTSFVELQGLRVDPSAESSCELEFTVSLPELAGGDYFITLGISAGEQEKHTPLKRYRNLIHLRCLPKRTHIFGVMVFPLNIKKICGDP